MLGVAAGANLLIGVWVFHRYRRMVDYCEEFEAPGLSCLADSRAEQLWLAVNFEIVVCAVVEAVLIVALAVAVAERQADDGERPVD